MSATMQAASAGAERLALTAGEIAAINLESARKRSWTRFWRAPEQPQVAELIVEQEQLTAQFAGTPASFDRLERVAQELARADPDSARTSLVAAQVACSTHRFAEARASLARAVAGGALPDSTDRLLLTIDQATGANLPAVLAARRRRAALPGRWEERIPLGALLADLGAFDEADHTYVEALRTYPDVSPFGPAWASFQLGVLWGELVPAPDATRAAKWYRTALDYLPCYVKARVHLAEIHLDEGRVHDAAALLAPALDSGDPEVSWRMADVARASGNAREAALHLDVARARFEAARFRASAGIRGSRGREFYSGSGDDRARALSSLRGKTSPIAQRCARRRCAVSEGASRCPDHPELVGVPGGAGRGCLRGRRRRDRTGDSHFDGGH